MNSETRNNLIVSFLILLASVGIMVFLFLQIEEKSHAFEEHLRVLADKEAKQQVKVSLGNQVTETQVERAQLSSFFLKSKNESIDLLNFLEELAVSFSLEAETTSLVEKEGVENIVILQFRYLGSESDVKKFTEALELMPYHSIITSLNIGESAEEWEGRATIEVTTLES